VQLKIEPDWGPNVYVSVLALRGRLREVPWYSFFTWGYKAPRRWWQAFWVDGKDHVPPTALVDLSKPAFRLGMAELKLGAAGHRWTSGQGRQDQLPGARQGAGHHQRPLPDGKPGRRRRGGAGRGRPGAAGADAQPQLEPAGRHAAAPRLGRADSHRADGDHRPAPLRPQGRAGGGGGGAHPTRELLDTLLLWQPRVQLDARGQAQVEVPLNDALTTFQIVAVADMGGACSAPARPASAPRRTCRSSAACRRWCARRPFRAQLTLRNTTASHEGGTRAARHAAGAEGADGGHPAGEARELPGT
jgi:hypothetical protein